MRKKILALMAAAAMATGATVMLIAGGPVGAQEDPEAECEQLGGIWDGEVCTILEFDPDPTIPDPTVPADPDPEPVAPETTTTTTEPAQDPVEPLPAPAPAPEPAAAANRARSAPISFTG